MSDYFTNPGDPAQQSRGVSALIRNIVTLVSAGFDKVAALTGNGGKLIRVNSGATAQEAMSLGTANQVLGMNSGATGYEHKTVSGTSNQITVTHGANSITLAAPQNLHTGASPTFAGITLSTTDLAVADGGTGASSAADARTNLGLAIGTDVQAYDADLVAVAGLSSTGLVARTGAGTASARTITAPAAGITVSNGDGVSGNPTLALANDLAALEGLSSNGMIARTGDGAASVRTITAPAAGITVSNGDGVSGNPTLALANDLAAIEGLAATGMIARTGDGTASVRTITAGAGCTVSNGNGVSGNPTVSLIPGIGLGDVLGPGVSVDSEIAIYNGTTGQSIKRATATGIIKGTSGVIGVAVSGTDIKTINSTSLLGSGDIAIPVGDVVGPSSSVDAEIALFDSTTGKLIKRATGSGIAKVTSGVLGTAVSGTDIKTVNGTSLLGSGDITAGGTWVLLSSATASASATVDLETTFDSTYDCYIIIAAGIHTANDGVNLLSRMKLGGAYSATGYQYHTHASADSAGAYASDFSAAATSMVINNVSANDTTRFANFWMRIYMPAATSYKTADWNGHVVGSGGALRLSNGAGYNSGTTGVLTGIRFFASAGNIDSGTFYLYGVKKS